MALWEMGCCIGDSLTTGARSRYGLAEALSMGMRTKTDKSWIWRCEAVNGETVLQMVRRMDKQPQTWKDVSFATIVIGTNDAKDTCRTSPDLYIKLLRQAVDRLKIYKIFTVVGLVPDLIIDEKLASPYSKGCMEMAAKYNDEIVKLSKIEGFKVVDTTGLPAEAYSDGVHFSESGINRLADLFSAVILSR